MNTPHSLLRTLAAASLLILSAAPAVAQAPDQRARELRQYTFGELNPGRYEVVSREWGDAWRSAFWSPTFATREQAVAALNDDAAARGAEALLNVHCLDQGRWSWSSNTEPAILCYAIGIRLRPN